MAAFHSVQELKATLLGLNLVSRADLDAAVEQLSGDDPQELLSILERRQLVTALQTSKLVRGDKEGYFLGRYKLLYKVSAGTFARVFRGVDPRTGQTVAVKVLRGRHTQDPQVVKIFHREGGLTEQLQHPNIARTLEVGTDAVTNQYYIVMEFVEGGNLREILNARGKINPPQAVAWLTEMADGLGYALKESVTHRDIKPTNILIASDGHVKLVDFGLAGLVEQSSIGGPQTFSTEQRTVDYAGLEKATNVPRGDPRSDIFFLGCVAYEMAAGRQAMESGDRNQRQWRGRFDGIDPLAGSGETPVGLARVIDKMCAFDPHERYQTYDDIVRDLKALDIVEDAAGNLTVQTQPRVGIVPRQ